MVTAATLLLVAAGHLAGEVVRAAPNFSWETFNGRSATLASVGRQPAVLIVAPSPRSRVFKKQLKEVERLYRQYAGRGTLFFAAFTSETGTIQSDIPFLYVRDPATVAAGLGLADRGFLLAVIGPDRNLDLVSFQVTGGDRIRDVIDNSQTQQSVRRAGQ